MDAGAIKHARKGPMRKRPLTEGKQKMTSMSIQSVALFASILLALPAAQAADAPPTPRRRPA
jgi:hypothetical protein